MKKRPEELNVILSNLCTAYPAHFGSSIDLAVLNEVLNEYLAQQQRAFIKNRIDGLDPLGIQYLLERVASGSLVKDDASKPTVVKKGKRIAESRKE